MKKQIKKLSLNKKTISNLTAAEMGNKIGGSTGCSYSCQGCGGWHQTLNCTKNGNTCPGHKTCYNC